MYFIGETNCRGVYYFHSVQLNGWLVCDVDNGTCKLFDKLALLKIENNLDTDDLLERMERRQIVLGQEGDRYLVEGERALIPLLRDFGDGIEVLMVYYPDGNHLPYGKLEREMAQIAARGKKKLKKYDPNNS